MKNNRNLILAMALALIVIFGWQVLMDHYGPRPAPVKPSAAQPLAQAPAPKPQDRAQLLAASPRIRIETPTLKGSLNLRGARIDDLILTRYKQELAASSPPVELYAPEGSTFAAFAGFGWAPQTDAPTASTVWTASGTTLTPQTPITLTWDNGHGQTFKIILSVDTNYMFNVDQSVVNHGPTAVTLAPIAYVSRNYPSLDRTSVAHVGPIANVDGAVNYSIDYSNLDGQDVSFFGRMFGNTSKAGVNSFTTTGGWLGFGDKYWLSALVPPQSTPVTAEFRKDGAEYRAGYWIAPATVAPGQTQHFAARLFAGAKDVPVVDAYQTAGVPLFGKVIDWGWFEVICKPLYWLIHTLYTWTGNFGVAIILTTFVIRGLLFPVAQAQFRSMAQLRVAQPKIKALQDRFKDDRAQLQQETMKLYKEEKINPLGGCLPALMPLPVFFALYKTLSVSIEMRHQPFALWIHDLSVPDPFLFGLVPGLSAQLPAFLAIGVLPILLGGSMWLIQRASPPPADPTQAQMMAIMPWMMMFFFSSIASGLQLYYIISNTITILQQQWFFSRHPVLKQPMAR